MEKRIFIAVRLPDEVLEKLIEAAKKWQWLPIRWLIPESWHVTLIPPFYANNEEVQMIREVLCDITKSVAPFKLSFHSIILAPPGKRARMIWLVGPRSRALQALKEVVGTILRERMAAIFFRREERDLTPHVTLARFHEGDLTQLEQKTKTLEELKLSFLVETLDILEAHLKPTGAEYTVIDSVHLGS